LRDESEFEIGDLVEIRSPRFPEDNGPATVIHKGFYSGNFHVKKTEGSVALAFPARELRPLTPKTVFVHVQTQRTIWVTLPGDTAGHKLSNDDALALLRQLEEALS
jgi:hypothetical protein